MNTNEIAQQLKDMGFAAEVITSKFGYKFVFVTLSARQVNSSEVLTAVESNPFLNDLNLTVKRVSDVVAVYMSGSKV